MTLTKLAGLGLLLPLLLGGIAVAWADDPTPVTNKEAIALVQTHANYM